MPRLPEEVGLSYPRLLTGYILIFTSVVLLVSWISWKIRELKKNGKDKK